MISKLLSYLKIKKQKRRQKKCFKAIKIKTKDLKFNREELHER